MQPVEREPTIAELYADLDHAKRKRRQSNGRIEDHIHWRMEIGRLTDAIRRAQMSAANSEREN